MHSYKALILNRFYKFLRYLCLLPLALFIGNCGEPVEEPVQYLYGVRTVCETDHDCANQLGSNFICLDNICEYVPDYEVPAYGVQPYMIKETE